MQASLLHLMHSGGRYRTYTKLAVSVALTFSCIAAIGLSNVCPALFDFLYFSEQALHPPLINDIAVVTPFVNFNFGEIGPRRSTAALGGSVGISLSGNQAMI